MNTDKIRAAIEGVVRKLINLASAVFLFVWNLRIGPVLAYGLSILAFALACWSAWIFFNAPGGRDFRTVDGDIDIIDEPNAETEFKLFRSELNSTKPSFFEPVTVSLARLCDGIYGDEKTTVPRTFYDLQFETVEPAVAGSQAALVGVRGDVVVVVFRGTNEIKDWYFNLDTRSEPCEHGSFHKGFWDAYAEVREGVVEKVKHSEAKHVWVTGHSLGGAMAMCCAYDLEVNERLRLSGLVTFGQPKLANATVANFFASGLSSRYLAIVNDRDPICEPAPGRYPCGTGVWLNGSKVEIAAFVNAVQRFEVDATGAPASVLDDSTEFLFKMMPEDVWQQKIEKIQQEDLSPLSALPPGVVPTGSSWKSILRFELPYIADHSMKRYIAKLERHHFRMRTSYALPSEGANLRDGWLEDNSVNY